MNTDTFFSPRGLASLLSFPFRNRETFTRFLFLGGFFALGWVFPLLPILISAGYLLEVLRLAAQGAQPTLPPWENWGRLLLNGLKVFGGGLVFLLPSLILAIKAFVLYFGGMVVFAALADAGREGLAFLLMFLAVTLLFVFQMLGFLFYLIGGTLLQPALAHMALRESFSALFDFKGWWRVFKASKGGFIVTFLLGVMLFYGIQLALALTFPIWIFFLFFLPVLTSFAFAYAFTLWTWLGGAAYSESLSTLEENASLE
ncbi:hypothetical protein ANT_27230 [Anaerolinea thermophila UNI-1]|uniref:DUF4013 domain-containing protein n=1 Tax=Anaerolinea thermophila (strain DSM 14523 / JCM 11388 / NBRC 100420 / UNI-1) TaxID=926569 RepID=E8N0K0_ANATU|nr:hypothetical protein ANT_27230 [Anaerolinea thermophila UNI-1]